MTNRLSRRSLAGVLAASLALSTGVASAAPLSIGSRPVASEAPIVQVGHRHWHHHGYHHHRGHHGAAVGAAIGLGILGLGLGAAAAAPHYYGGGPRYCQAVDAYGRPMFDAYGRPLTVAC